MRCEICCGCHFFAKIDLFLLQLSCSVGAGQSCVGNKSFLFSRREAKESSIAKGATVVGQFTHKGVWRVACRYGAVSVVNEFDLSDSEKTSTKGPSSSLKADCLVLEIVFK